MLYFKLYFRFVLIFLLGFYPNKGFGQAIDNEIATTFDGDNKVVEITLPEYYEGKHFILYFLKDGNTRAAEFIGRAGKHYYDVRGHLAWEGIINGLVTDLPKDSVFVCKLKDATLFSGMDVFFAPDRFSPTTINLVWLKTFFGMRWSVFLFFLSIIIGASIYILKRVFKNKTSIGIALGISIIICAILMDFRTMLDHYSVVKNTEVTYPYISPVENAQKIVQIAKKNIGNGIWKTPRINDEFQRLYIQSQLAGFPTIREERTKQIIYKITNKPNEEERIIAQEGAFYLTSNQ